jgi:uncharacterized protein
VVETEEMSDRSKRPDHDLPAAETSPGLMVKQPPTVSDGAGAPVADGASWMLPPEVTPESAGYWDALNDRRLVVDRCLGCGSYTFPPRGMCRTCRALSLTEVEISGPGRLYSFTVNHYEWIPGQPVPFALGLVEFPDYPGVRLLGPLRGLGEASWEIGMDVRVGFDTLAAGFTGVVFEAAP